VRSRSRRVSRAGRSLRALATGGRALAERGASGDGEQAAELLDACLVKARAFGMAHLTEQAEALRARLA
jgi:hypothetical protein